MLFKTDIRRKFMIFAIVPSLLLAISFLFFTTNIQEENIKENHTKILKIADYKLSLLHTKLTSLEQLIVESNNKNKQIFNNILRFNQEISSILILGQDGKIKKIYNKNNPQSVDKNFNYFEELGLSKFLETKKSSIGNIYTISQTNQSFIPYLFEFKGFIYLVNIDLEYLKNYFNEFMIDNQSFKLYLVDNNGLFIINPSSSNNSNPKEIFYNTPYAKALLVNPEYQLLKIEDRYKNQTQRLTYAIQKESNWKIIIKDEYDKVYDSIKYVLIIIAIFMILLIIVTIVTANKVAKNIVEPIESLILEIEDFANATEHFEETSTIKSKYFIFNLLIDSFETMKNDIIDREIELKNLNETLEEKTAQLELFNQTLQVRLQNEI